MAARSRPADSLRALAEVPLGGGYALVLGVQDGDPRHAVHQIARRDGADREPLDDPGFAAALLRAMGAAADVERAAPLRGEQTNTSIVVGLADGAELVVKLFRTVQHGENPDVELQQVLSDAGADFVPRFTGALEAEWSDPDGTTACGHLAVAQEFVRGATDGWVLATRAAAADESFAGHARAIGRITARMHAVLAERLPTTAPSPGAIAAQSALWLTRLDEAAAAVPAIEADRGAIEAAYDAARAAAWPALQRIHGDLHLGQLLHRDGRWVVLDFEGEPLRSLAERIAPEPALRDVAGMLRSIDYASAADGRHAAAWGDDARAAYLEGYREAAGVDALAPAELLRAFELDKAVYEALYEARHRPSWIGIPTAAIARLTRSR